MTQTVSNVDPATRQLSDSAEWASYGTGQRSGHETVLRRLRLIWNRRRFLLRVVIFGLATATTVVLLIPASYESTAQLMPPDSNSDGLALLAGFSGPGSTLGGNALSGLAGDLLGMKNTGALFMGVLKSRTIQDHIIDRFDLMHVYHVRLEANAERKLSGNTEISEDRKSGIITLTVTDHDAKRAADIAGLYIEELNALMASLSTSSAHRERVFLEDRLNNVSNELEAAERDFSQFSSRNATIDVGTQERATLESSAMLQGQLIAAQSELEGLKQIFTENNVRVRSVEARISELRLEINKLAGQPDAQPSNNLVNVNDPYPSVRQLPLLGVGYADHLRRVRVDEAVFETLTTEYELAKVQEAKEIPTVKVLDPPNIAQRKSFPPRLIIVSVGTVFAEILGVVWIVGSASWSEVDPHDPWKTFATEIFHKLEAQFPWLSKNGAHGSSVSRNGSRGDKDWL